ncbi:2-keto-4-pentenoate hydratase [Salinibacterium hongtaonis]|uniref:2-keto-4-pentenoate hydratase n=1 Tax=Homoserinimonas hongtaonis TaxID=2079791 RepID=UPI000D340A53|nr:2-keto-4-pentenoate hydratase [Salinibacterium hongtaonis]AWB90362.1 2-keto-4-pentenoate hydratase [Salinibacterium hongtaonis]
MSLTTTATEALGTALLTAHETQQPIAPLTTTAPDMTVEDAYGVQMHQVAAWKNAGRRVIGYKVGLTSLAMQKQLGVDQPDFGHLFDDMLLDASAPVSLAGFIAPRIEPEISFVLSKDVTGPGLTIEELADAVDHAVISLEIIDSRIADWKITLADTIADNASSGAVLVGEGTAQLDGVDLAALPVSMRRNGETVGEGVGAAVLGHPLEGALWLANTLGSLGQTLPAGSLIMAGSITAAVAIAPGDTISASFGELGTLDVTFA